jgi:DNA-binding transcriptional ArsR family regulator
MAAMTPARLASVAKRFKVLAEPARLRVLDALRHGARHVSALAAATGLQQANLSRHLQQLHAHGFVVRHRQGTFVHYAIADRQVFASCDLMCGQLERSQRLRRGAAPLQAAPHPGARRASRVEHARGNR